jgi:hypothetical protein
MIIVELESALRRLGDYLYGLSVSVSNDCQRHFALLFLSDRTHDIAFALDRLAVDLDDNVTRFETGFRGR